MRASADTGSPPCNVVAASSTDRTFEAKDRLSVAVLLGLVFACAGCERSLWDTMLVRYRQEWQEVDVLVGYMQAFVLISGGLFWGILASQDVLSRKQLVIIMCVVHGLNCLVEPIFPSNKWLHIGLHLVVKFFVAPLEPLCRSIVADVVGAKSHSEIYGLHFVCLFGSLRTTRWILDSIGGTYGDSGLSIVYIAYGCSALLIGMLLYYTLSVPPVVPSQRPTWEEFRMLAHFLKTPTFSILVVQGTFGAIPYKTLHKQINFFKLFGLQGSTPELIHTVGLFAIAAGSILGGSIGDQLARRSMLQGRIACAQISVFGGIPLAYLLYCVSPDTLSLPAGTYFVTMVVIFGLVINWPISGTNPQLLFSIANPDQRVLAFTSHWALQEASAFIGQIVFYIFFQEPNEGDDNPASLGFALFRIQALPWLICGLLYSSLHLTFKEDVERTIKASLAKLQVNSQISELISVGTMEGDWSTRF